MSHCAKDLRLRFANVAKEKYQRLGPHIDAKDYQRDCPKCQPVLIARQCQQQVSKTCQLVRQLMQRGHLKDWCQLVRQQMPIRSAQNTSRPRYLKLSECQQVAPNTCASQCSLVPLASNECRQRLVPKAGAKDECQMKSEDQDQHQLVPASTN